MTDITSIRMSSAQTMLRVLKDTNADSRSSRDGSTNSPLSSSYLLQSFGAGTADETEEDIFYGRFEALQASVTEAQSQIEAETTSGIGSKSFMTALKARLEELKATPDGKVKAEEMLAALDAGTLTVTDAAAGETIKAWDVSADNETGTISKPTEETDASGWSDFLRDRLTRGSNATYLIGPNGAYVDKVSGESAYFGTIGETYAYLSWPATGASA
ncbi:hypothetical protein J5J10_09010 [Ciceribacter sp. L1K23]|uniref:hypothetical protein n=1 Tax=Ciceribacter sp. L1K23 TaxID=2820276 RepID=UPI001B82EE4C|nr:hypothetical protein [Ciceribacter sp. L1K23]MBR0555819.1 hypothetical protein [Ciceribacter sp. L1K23]